MNEDRVEQVIQEHEKSVGSLVEVLEIVAIILGGTMCIAAILGGAMLLGLI